MDEALTRMALVSDGGVMRLKARITGTRSVDDAPSSELATAIDELDRRYSQCKTHRGRLAVIKEAQTRATQLRYSPDRSKVRGTKEWREAIVRDPRSCRTLATIYGVDFSTISRIKKKARES